MIGFRDEYDTEPPRMTHLALFSRGPSRVLRPAVGNNDKQGNRDSLHDRRRKRRHSPASPIAIGGQARSGPVPSATDPSRSDAKSADVETFVTFAEANENSSSLPPSSNDMFHLQTAPSKE